MLLLSLLDKSINYVSLLGILCGSLTSTPGLSSVCERIGNGSENAVIGYGCSYLFGVILEVFFAQLFARRCTDNSKSVSQQQEPKSKIYLELILIGLTALSGNILGSIKISTLSFGTTACTLMLGLIVGYGFKKASKKSSISLQCLNAFRNLGLALAIEHLEIASARGNMYADYRLAQIYLFEADLFDMEKALEYLNRSAHTGNESAALALTRMANNQCLAVATNVLDLVGSLASIESYRQPQDCTTMPISRKERKKHEWEQSM